MKEHYHFIIKDIPPSNNKYIGKGSKGLRYTYQADKQMWAELIWATCRPKPPQPIKKSTVQITYFFKTMHRRDPDNYSGKFILDGLVNAGILIDDSFDNIDLKLKGRYDKDNPRTEVEIWTE